MQRKLRVHHLVVVGLRLRLASQVPDTGKNTVKVIIVIRLNLVERSKTYFIIQPKFVGSSKIFSALR